MLAGRSDDGVHLAGLRQAHRGLDRMAREAAGAQRARVVGPVAGALSPGTDTDAMCCGNVFDEVVGADDGYRGVQRQLQRRPGDLGTDAARIAEGHREAAHQDSRTST